MEAFVDDDEVAQLLVQDVVVHREDKKSKKPSVIVQEVSNSIKFKSCKEKKYGDPITDHYWEAWEVLADSAGPASSTDENTTFDDHFRWKDGVCCTQGDAWHKGQAYYCEGVSWESLKDAGWKMDRVAGDLITTREDPTKNPPNLDPKKGSGPADRWIKGMWNCCKEEKDSALCPDTDGDGKDQRWYNDAKIIHGSDDKAPF